MAELKATPGISSCLSSSSGTSTCLLKLQAASTCLIKQKLFFNSTYTRRCSDVAIPSGSGEFSFVSQSFTATLVGYSEFVTPSIPPVKFLRIDASGSSDRCWYGNPEGTGTATSDGYYPSGYSEYDRVTGVFDQKTGKLEARYDNIPGCHHPPALISNTYRLDRPTTTNFPTTGYSYVVTKDRVEMTGKGVLFKPVDSPPSARATGTWVTQLSEPDDEESALARATPTVGTLSTASHSLRGVGEFTFTATRVFVTANLSGLQSGVEYVLSYLRTTTNTALGTSVVEPVELIFTATAASEAIDLGEIPCAPGYSATVSDLEIVPVNPVIPGNSITVPVGQFTSLISQEDADAQAVEYAIANLVCKMRYYEIPFSQELTLGWYFDDAAHQGPVSIAFYGKVRLWASGTVEMLGSIKCNRAGQEYRVWIGPTTTTGAFHVVGTTVLAKTWEDVYWVHHPDEGSYVHCILGADFGTAAVWLRKLWSFEDGGWAFPIVFDNFGTTNADMDGTITRSETAITCTGRAYNYLASAAWDWWSSVTPGETPNDWIYSGYSGVMQVSTPTYTTTAAIPDSATTGIYARWYSGSPYPGAVDVTRICSVGPFYRPEHDPVVQIGVDPFD